MRNTVRPYSTDPVENPWDCLRDTEGRPGAERRAQIRAPSLPTVGSPTCPQGSSQFHLQNAHLPVLPTSHSPYAYGDSNLNFKFSYLCRLPPVPSDRPPNF